jgi:hypothetical protein
VSDESYYRDEQVTLLLGDALEQLRTLHGGNAAANALVLLGNVIHGSTTLASISAAVMALSLWQWWNSGGGDDTKRRLRKWARKFQGVRRTAPAGSAA